MGFVGRNNVFNIEYYKMNRHREFLKITINQHVNSQVVVIMKNPSTTCIYSPNGNQIIRSYSGKKECRIDRSTGKVLRKLRGVYDEIIILNLYSLYDKNPKNVNSYYYINNHNSAYFMNSNNNFIRKFLSSYKGDVICAWGNNNGISINNYYNQIMYVSSLFTNNHNLFEYDSGRKQFIKRNHNNNYPAHGLTWK